jgi:predicted permease
MEALLRILVISFGSIGIGYGIQHLLRGFSADAEPLLTRTSNGLKFLGLLVLQPIAILNSFWTLNLQHVELVIMPVLGVMSIAVGAGAAMLCIQLFDVPPSRAGSVLTASMFTNLGVFAALIAFVLYGPVGFSLVQLFRVFEETTYYAIGFPLSRQVASGPLKEIRLDPRHLGIRPIVLVPLGAIIVGASLKWLGVTSPPVLDDVSQMVVPTMTAMLGSAIGLTLRITKVNSYRREIAMVVITKFIVIPLVIVPIAWVSGLGSMLGGVPFKVVVIASCMPTAFLAVVPPAIYGFDLDLANSAWLVTTLGLLVVAPILLFVLA